MEVNTKILQILMPPKVFLTSPLPLTPLKTMAIPKYIIVTFFETDLFLLSHAYLSLTFWSHAFAIVVYLINCIPTPHLNHSF